MQWEAIIFQFKKIKKGKEKTWRIKYNESDAIKKKTKRNRAGGIQEEGASLTGGGGTGRIVQIRLWDAA